MNLMLYLKMKFVTCSGDATCIDINILSLFIVFSVFTKLQKIGIYLFRYSKVSPSVAT